MINRNSKKKGRNSLYRVLAAILLVIELRSSPIRWGQLARVVDFEDVDYETSNQSQVVLKNDPLGYGSAFRRKPDAGTVSLSFSTPALAD